MSHQVRNGTWTGDVTGGKFWKSATSEKPRRTKKGELERGRGRVRKERLEDPALRRRAGRGRGPRRRRKGGKPGQKSDAAQHAQGGPGPARPAGLTARGGLRRVGPKTLPSALSSAPNRPYAVHPARALGPQHWPPSLPGQGRVARSPPPSLRPLLSDVYPATL